MQRNATGNGAHSFMTTGHGAHQWTSSPSSFYFAHPREDVDDVLAKPALPHAAAEVEVIGLDLHRCNQERKTAQVQRRRQQAAAQAAAGRWLACRGAHHAVRFPAAGRYDDIVLRLGRRLAALRHYARAGARHGGLPAAAALCDCWTQLLCCIDTLQLHVACPCMLRRGASSRLPPPAAVAAHARHPAGSQSRHQSIPS